MTRVPVPKAKSSLLADASAVIVKLLVSAGGALTSGLDSVSVDVLIVPDGSAPVNWIDAGENAAIRPEGRPAAESVVDTGAVPVRVTLPQK